MLQSMRANGVQMGGPGWMAPDGTADTNCEKTGREFTVVRARTARRRGSAPPPGHSAHAPQA
eukprot:3463265-Prymnesium_polylepis.1